MSQIPPPLPGATLNYRGPGGGMDQSAWRVMNRLVTLNHAILPERCVRCNSTEDVRMKRKEFAWCNPWIYATILAGWLVALILVLVLQKKSTLTFGMCGKCRTRRVIVTTIGLGLVGLAVALIVAAISLDTAWPAIVAAFTFLGAIIFLAIALPILRPRRIDASGQAEFSGCCEEFLASL